MVTSKELRIPFSWQERHIVIANGAWLIPPCTHDPLFSFPGWHDPTLFSNEQPIHIEYCSGNGAWIIEQARHFPYINWLAVEKRFDRIRKIWAKAKNQLLTNLVVVWAEAYALTSRFIPSMSVAKVYINFPDPWPKRRQKKHRLISAPFVQEQARILQAGSTISVVTDHQEYSLHIIELMRQHPAFTSLWPEPYFTEAPQEYGTSFFDALFRSQKIYPRLHQFIKI
jgi:tRNA (guanine-N7-)-methyltransferase